MAAPARGGVAVGAATPCRKQYQCAEATGYSRWHVSRIIGSPEFKRRFQIVLDMRLQHMVVRRSEYKKPA